ncbi:MAG: thioredoxin family protein [Chitinophagales bacterium]
MKTRFLILLLSAIANLSLAQGIEFFEGSLEEALAKAKLEDKLIFIDAYTTWCGPCKAMNKNVFTDVNVGEFYNKSFINLKIDQEKGEGLDFAKKYNVRFYPTFVFINSEGEMAHKAVGYIEVEDFILLGAAATNDNYQLLSLQNKYDKGDKNSRVLKNLANALSEAYMDNSEEIALEYLATQTDWKNDENIAFIYNHFSN